jgi:Holliday junction resolvase
MGKSQRDKGARAERAFAKLISGERVPLSGAAGGSYVGDVVGMGMIWECKVRKDGFKQLYSWMDGKDALAIKADRKEWMVVLPLWKLQELLEEKGKVIAQY